MTQIRGEIFLTISSDGAEIYEVDFISPPRLDIMNNTDDDILLGTDSVLFNNQTVGQYITLPPGTAANDLSMPFSKVYIKAMGSGDITIARCS